MRTSMQREKRLWLRYACLVLAGIETVLLTLYAAIMVGMGLSSDALGSAIGKGMAGLTAIPLLAFALPALVARGPRSLAADSAVARQPWRPRLDPALAIGLNLAASLLVLRRIGC